MKMFASLLALLLPLAASAQTMSIHVDDQGVLTRSYDVLPATQFEVVTKIDLGGEDLKAVEWVQTALTSVAPGTFKLGETVLCPWLTLEFRPEGEYWFGCATCFTGSPDLELARVRYGAFAGPVPMDTVMEIRGFQPDDSVPSTFGGSPGFVDCDENLIPAAMEGGDALITGSGVVVPSGALVLNPTPPVAIPTGERSFARIKGQFR